jgi:hypothetical protein
MARRSPVNNNDERDYAEERYNGQLLREERDDFPCCEPATVDEDQAAGLVDEPAEQAALVMDRDGDVWERCGDAWWLPPAGEPRTWEEVRDRFGPLVLAGRVETLAELVQEWADQGGPLQESMDRLDSTLEQLLAPPMTEDERAAVVARIEG